MVLLLPLLLTYCSNLRVLEELVPEWVRNITLHMDNAGTNKNRWVIFFLAALVKVGRLDLVDISFMVVGHTKVRNPPIGMDSSNQISLDSLHPTFFSLQLLTLLQNRMCLTMSTYNS